jgi:uncharacterized protein YjdB
MDLARHHWKRRAGVGIVAASLALIVGGGGLVAATSAGAADPPTLTIDKADYQDKIAALWMAQTVAENAKGGSIAGVAASNVNTTLEYLFFTAMTQEARNVKLTGADIRKAFNSHITGPEVWFSSAVADLLMETGAEPPGTTSPVVNQYRNLVDAFIGTEFIGALAPGRPDIALDIAQLPIRTLGGGYGATAGQFEVLLTSLAPAIPPTLTTGAAKIQWLLTTAISYLPDDAVIKDVIRFLIAEYQSNPSASAADLKTAQRAAISGSTATQSTLETVGNQVIALLIGAGDFSDSWNALKVTGSDPLNLWAGGDVLRTLSVVFGLMLGTDGLLAEFAEIGAAGTPSPLYGVTNMVNLPDFVPADDAAVDTFAGIGARSLALIEQTTLAGGGTVSDDAFTVTLTDPPASSAGAALAAVNPDYAIYHTSANAQARAAGTLPTVTTDLVGNDALYTARANAGWRPTNATYRPRPARSNSEQVLADGLEGDERGLYEATGSGNTQNPVGAFFVGGVTATPSSQITIEYPAVLPAATGVRWYSGDTDIRGGLITAASIEVDPGTGVFAPVTTTQSEAFNRLQPYQQVDLAFPAPRPVKAVRVTIAPASDHVNLAEIDTLVNTAFAAPTYPVATPPVFDSAALAQALTAASWLSESDYTLATWATLADAVAAAQALMVQVSENPAGLVQGDLDAAAAAVNAARTALVFLPDTAVPPAREALTQVLAAARAVPRAGLTEGSWNALQAAIAAAQITLANPASTATALRQAASALTVAGAGLRPAQPQPAPAPTHTVQVPAPPTVVTMPPSSPATPPGTPLGADKILTPYGGIADAGARIHLAQTSLVLLKGQRAKVPVSAFDPTGKALAVTWKSSAKKVATVSGTGVIKARAAGTAVITVKAGKDTARIAIRVPAKRSTLAVKSVALRGVPATLSVGQVAFAESVVKPAKAVKALVTYKSSAPGVVSIDKSGRLSALAPGSATITAKAGTKTVTRTVTVS